MPIRRGCADEAAAISMTGGRRVVRIRGADNALTEISSASSPSPSGDALVVVEAGDLAKTGACANCSRTARQRRRDPCYPDIGRAISKMSCAAR